MSARTVRDARLQAHVDIATAAGVEAPSLEEDVRRVVPAWADVLELVEGARKRGWTERQMEYLTAVVGVTWAKAYRKGEAAARVAAGLSAEAP